MRVIEHAGENPTSARPQRLRAGPEQELTEWFIDQLHDSATGTPFAVFREVKLPGGTPDVVVVFWDPAVFVNWPHDRPDLTPRTLKVLHYIYSMGGADLMALRVVFGKAVQKDVDLLVAANMVTTPLGTYQAEPLATSYAVRNIVAVEAKVSRWTIAIQQAARNRWFASDSYVLLPSWPRSLSSNGRPMSSSIGIIARSIGVPLHFGRAEPSPPLSYVSWAFNEWMWEAWRSDRP